MSRAGVIQYTMIPTEGVLDGRTIQERVYVLTGEMHVEEGGLELDDFGHAWDAGRVSL